MLLGGELQIDAHNFKFWNFWECPLYEIWEYTIKSRIFIYLSIDLLHNMLIRYRNWANFFSKDDGHIVPWIVIIVPPVNIENSSFYSHNCTMICPHPSHNLCTLNMIKMWRTYVWSCMPTLPHTVSFHLNVSVHTDKEETLSVYLDT